MARPIASHWSVVGVVRGSSGASARAVASSAARPVEAEPSVPRAPRHAHGRPPRPSMIAATCTAHAAANRIAPARSAAVEPAAIATPSAASTHDQRAPTRRCATRGE